MQKLFDTLNTRTLKGLRQLRRGDTPGVSGERAAHGSGLLREVGRKRRLRTGLRRGLRGLLASDVERRLRSSLRVLRLLTFAVSIEGLGEFAYALLLFVGRAGKGKSIEATRSVIARVVAYT